MFDLLFGPLKKGKRAVNQFFIFFRVIGRIFDDMKKDVFRLREESNVVSASAVMLPVHGQDRDMPRLLSEAVEDYRTRLSMKALIASMAGTKESLELCLKSLGFDGEIIPYFLIDNTRWAEFLVKIYFPLDDTRFINMDTIRGQIRGLKPASAKDNYLFDFNANYLVGVNYNNRIRFSIGFYPRYNLSFLHLDGTWSLAGERIISGYNSAELLDFYPITSRYLIILSEEVRPGEQLKLLQEVVESITASSGIVGRANAVESISDKENMTLRTKLQNQANIDQVRVTVMNKLDGWKMDSTRKLNGGLSVL